MGCLHYRYQNCHFTSSKLENTSPSYRPICLQSTSTLSSSTTVHHLPGSAAWQSLQSTTRGCLLNFWVFQSFFSSSSFFFLLSSLGASPAEELIVEKNQESYSVPPCLPLNAYACLYPCLETLHWIEISISVDFHSLVYVISSQLLNLLIAHGSSPNMWDSKCAHESFPPETWPPCSTCATEERS